MISEAAAGAAGRPPRGPSSWRFRPGFSFHYVLFLSRCLRRGIGFPRMAWKRVLFNGVFVFTVNKRGSSTEVSLLQQYSAVKQAHVRTWGGAGVNVCSYTEFSLTLTSWLRAPLKMMFCTVGLDGATLFHHETALICRTSLDLH